MSNKTERLFADTEAQQRQTPRCWHCGRTDFYEVLEESGPHYGRRACSYCHNFQQGWLPKPENEKRPRRGNGDRNLGLKYSRGWCEMCLQSEAVFGPMVGHHVIEYRHDGPSDRTNVWVLCSRCHDLVHWTRRAYGRDKPEEARINAELDV